MVTVFGAKNVRYKGMAADTKPTNARNGDRFIEMDKRSLYLYDEANATWRLMTSNLDPTSNLVGLGQVGYMIID